MSIASLTEPAIELGPVASSERIQALDVVRGFALIGIFLMNIEFFNRPTTEIGSGLPVMQGADAWAGYLIYVLVQGKFWTMFSLLFGMGFAVMLTRAERAGRSFLVPYLRRIAALAAFGAFHHIFLWAGDILFSYAVGALCLLLLMWARWIPLLIGMVLIFASGFLPGMDPIFQVFAGLLFVLLGALFLRSEARLGKSGSGLPWLSVVFLAIGAIMAAVAAIAGNGPVPVDARWPMAIGGFFLLLLGVLSAKFKNPVEERPRRLGGTMYLVPFFLMLAFGLLQVYGPARPVPTEAQIAAATVEVKAMEAAEKAGRKTDPVAAKAAQDKKSPEEKAAIGKAQQRIRLAEHAADVAEERRLLTGRSYTDLVRMRASNFVEHAPGQFGFATLIVGMFLLGYWFVRSGIMEDTAGRLPLFRRMAMIGIPLGVGLGILSTQISTHVALGVERDPYQIAMSLMMIGNLPACLGYVGLVVLMLHSHGPLSRIRVLAPLGRMALTNYLTHSLIGSLYFFGYAGGHYGMGRAMQVGFVFVVIALQIVFCHWWLARFRYGPMEWLWRAITYWQLPAMRRERTPELGAGGAAA